MTSTYKFFEKALILLASVYSRVHCHKSIHTRSVQSTLVPRFEQQILGFALKDNKNSFLQKTLSLNEYLENVIR